MSLPAALEDQRTHSLPRKKVTHYYLPTHNAVTVNVILLLSYKCYVIHCWYENTLDLPFNSVTSLSFTLFMKVVLLHRLQVVPLNCYTSVSPLLLNARRNGHCVCRRFEFLVTSLSSSLTVLSRTSDLQFVVIDDVLICRTRLDKSIKQVHVAHILPN